MNELARAASAVDFTPSKRALLRSCARWLLPGVSWIELDRAEYERGNDFHAAINALVKTGITGRLAGNVSREVAHASAWLYEQHQAGKRFDSEVVLAWNVLTDTARHLPSSAPRDYSQKTPDEKAGTVDLISFDGGRVIVWDWQTTHTGGDPPDKTDQLRTYALWVARVYEVDSVGIGEILVTEQGVYPSEVTWLDAIELDAECDALRAELAQSPEPKPGPHCKGRRCPAIGSCEAMQTHAAELVPADQLVKGHRITTDITGPDHAYWLLIASEMVKEALGPIRQALEEYANKNGGIPSPDGRVWSGAPKSSETPQLDVPGAVDIVRAAGGMDAVEMKTTWTALTRVLGEDKAEQIRAALRAHGATKATSYPEFRFRKQKIGKPRAA